MQDFRALITRAKSQSYQVPEITSESALGSIRTASPLGRRTVLSLALVVLALIGPLFLHPYLELEFTLAFGYAMGCLGLNLITGYTGQVSLGQSFFFAAGAYFSGWLVASERVEFLVALPVAVILTFALALILAAPLVRLRGFNLALVTIGLALAVGPLSTQLTGFTGGAAGLTVPPLASPFGLPWALGGFLYITALVALLLSILIIRQIVRGNSGRGMSAIRDRAEAAEALGVHGDWIRARSFALGAALAAAGGWVYVMSVGFLGPTSFPILLSVYFLAGIVIGGTRSILGSMIGGLIIEFLPPLASDINEGAASLALGGVLVLAVVFAPDGIVGHFMTMERWLTQGVERVHVARKTRTTRDESAS